jgi:hydrogenase-4 component B
MTGLPPPSQWLHIDWMLVVASGWLLVGAAGVLALHRLAFVAHVLFPLGGCWAWPWPAWRWRVAGHARGGGVAHRPAHAALPPAAGQPGGLFLLVIGAASAGISAFAAGYFRKGEGTPPGLLCLEYHVFLASMLGVVLADDAYAFMVMWETMALSSFFLVTANHRIPEVRGAGYLYITMARVGAIAILLCFGVLQAGTGDYTFDNMRAQSLSPFWASAGFGLAVFGFGAKAGIVPLHVWLPEAHPAAPSPVSALMSGVMLNTAIYGLLRVALRPAAEPLWWWGVGLLLAMGLATALFGVVFAAVQTDMKRLLAYSSIENMGLLFVGMGLALIFSGYGMQPMAALALTATLYHVAATPSSRACCSWAPAACCTPPPSAAWASWAA